MRGDFFNISQFNFLILLTILFGPGNPRRVRPVCDTRNPEIETEGRIGEKEGDTPIFPWVGLLKVFLQDHDMSVVAMTGLVLIHKEYAIAHANDVARIPPEDLEQNTVMMFMAEQDRPWHCRPKNYHVHADYEVVTVNTIAILQLDLTDVGNYPLKSLCWHKRVSSVNSNLFVVGFVQENTEFEKVIYKTDLINKTECQKMYERDGLNVNKREPRYFQCGVSNHFNYACVWNNGMVVVSNQTKKFNLVGLTAIGPGCASPARFIDLEPYFDWVSHFIARRTHPVKTNERTKIESPNIPVHEMFVNDSIMKFTRRDDAAQTSYYDVYDTNLLGQNVAILSQNASKLIVYKFQGQLELINEACKGDKKLTYTDWITINHFPPDENAFLSYKLSFYDILNMPYGCFKLLSSEGNTRDMTVHYAEVMEMTEKDFEFETTPDQFYRVFGIDPLYPEKKKKGKKAQEIKPDVKVPFLISHVLAEPFEAGRRRVKNYDIFFTIPFTEKIDMVLEIYNDKPGPKDGGRRYIDNDLFELPDDKNSNWLKKLRTKPYNEYKNNSRKKIETHKNVYKSSNIISRTTKRPEKYFPRTPQRKHKKIMSVTRAPKPKSNPVFSSDIFDFVNDNVFPPRIPQYSPLVLFSSNAAAFIRVTTTYQLIVIIAISISNINYIQ